MAINLVDWDIEYFYYLLTNIPKKEDQPIQKQEKNIIEMYNTKFSNLENMTNDFIQPFRKKFAYKKENCLQREYDILRKIINKKNNDIINNKKNNDIINGYFNYTKKERVQLWTNLIIFNQLSIEAIGNKFNNAPPDEAPPDEAPPDDVCFKIIASSQEFAYKMRSESGYSYISRERFNPLENKKDVEQEMINWFSKNGSSIKAAITDFKKDFGKEIEQAFDSAFRKIGIKDNKIMKSKMKEVENALSQLGTVLDEKYKTELASPSFSEKLYEDLHNDLRIGLSKLLKDYDIKEIKVYHQKSTPYITIEKAKSTGLVQEEKEKETKLKNAFKNAIEKAIKIFDEKQINTFNLVGIGKISIDKNILLNFYKNATSFYNKNINSIIEKMKFDSHINYDSGVIGLIGEFVSLINFKRIGTIKYTGNLSDTVKVNGKEYNLGSSFSDILITGIGGVNVKHYMKADSSIELYSKGSGFLILSKYAFRYFSPQELAILRFLEANYSLVKEIFEDFGNNNEETLREKYKILALINLDNFIRADSGISDQDNLFYQLSNLILPASVIYEQILDLFLQKDFKNIPNILFETSGNMLKVDRININKKDEETEKHQLVNTAMFNKKGGTRLTFKGWTINLKELWQTL